MKIKHLILCCLTATALLYSCTGCSSGTDEEVQPLPEESGKYTASDRVIYEANPRLFASEKAFDAIRQQLDHIQGLGTSVLWLMPVQTPGVKKSVNSPYCIKDYKGLNEHYGTLDELKLLVRAAHDKGMKVILDWVANHTSWDHAWIEAHPDWYTKDANGNITSPLEQNWSDVADLNYSNTAMQEAMIEAMTYWVKEVGIDGYRCDYAEGVPDAFWKQAITTLRSINQELIMLAEGSKTSLMADGFDLMYGWNFHTRLKELYNGQASIEALYQTNENELSGMPKGTLRLRYSTNHDQASESSPIQCYQGKLGALSAFVLATMLDGVPLIYSSQEAAYGQKVNFFNYTPIVLDADGDFYQATAAIISAYKQSKGVRGGELMTYSTGQVATFYRKAEGHGLLVMVNTSNETVQAKVPIEHAGSAMTDLISREQITLPTVLTLEAYQYIICMK